MDENSPPVIVPPPPGPPPPLGPPPVVAPASPPKPPSRGRGWMVLALVLLALLAISFLFNLSSLASGLLHGKAGRYARTSGPRLEEVTREDNDSASKIAVVEVTGIISGHAIDQSGFGMVEVIQAQLKRAEEDEHVKAVILKVDSPGGEVLASDEICQAVDTFQTKSGKPVVASMGSLAASGGYYVSSPCRWIVANDLTITGSIGVIMSSWNYRGLMDKVGVQPETYKSGKYKDMLSGSREPNDITPEERAMVQGLIDQTYSKFKQVVQAGRSHAHDQNRLSKDSKDRGQALSNNWTNYADGRVLSGTEAFNLGFVDELGNFDRAVDRAKKLAGISTANLIEFQQRFDLADLFRIFGKSETHAVKVDVGLDIPKLQAGQPYFLSPTFLR